MAGKVSKELAKTEMPGTMLSPVQEIERWFNEAFTSPFSLLTRTTWPVFRVEEVERMSPVVDIYGEGNDVVMKADLPGVKRGDVHLDLSDNILMLSGERKTEEKSEKGNLYRHERSHGSFCRSFELPVEVDKEKITAHLEDGVLEIRLPKSEKAEKEARKISIS